MTIPKALREKFGLEEGDELLWVLDEDAIRVRKATRSPGRGMLVDDAPAEKCEEMEAKIRERCRTE